MSLIENYNSYKSSAKIVGITLNWIGYTIAAWIIFKPEPYMLAIWIGILYPLLSMTIAIFYKGEIEIEEDGKKKKEKEDKPSIYLSILLLCCALGLRGILDFKINVFSKAILPMILGGLFFCLFIFLVLRLYKKPLKVNGGIVVLCVLSFAWAYGGVMVLNYNYDPLHPRSYETEVLDKYIYTNDNSDTYYLTAAPWEKQSEEENLSVSENLYNETVIGDMITLYYSEGLFGIPYFIVDDK